MRKVDLLRDLQEIDLTLDRAQADLSQCSARLGDDSELTPFREDAASARQHLLGLQRRGRELDAELEDLYDRLKTEEKKLYGGTVKNPKELEGLAKEVARRRERISHLEDEALMNLDSVEEASVRLRAAETALAEKERDWKAAQQQLRTECDSLARQVEMLTDRRGQAAARVDPATLRIYEGLRRSRGGVAVVPVEQRACQGCRISLSSAEVQRARSSTELVACQSCGRILYVP